MSVVDNGSFDSTDMERDSGVESMNSADAAKVCVRVSVPDLNLQKCLQFHLDDTVWTAKKQLLESIAKEVKDGLNYGLYNPPVNGKAGKFLDEERTFREYPLPSPIGFLEFKFKRRVYKHMHWNPKKLKQLHTKANLKQLMEYIKKCDIEKVSILLNKGLDPNFIDQDSGENPLTLAAMLTGSSSSSSGSCVQLLMTLVEGGAHVDLRNRRGLTALHVAAQKDNSAALRTLLDLGASPNYLDGHGLTPLYHAVCATMNGKCVEMLLYDHSIVSVADQCGLTELHQACKRGHVQHVEQLIYYGAEMNIQNSAGNTALHVCAANNQEECARVLLFRGIDKWIKNFANQTASEVAALSNNMELSAVISDFQEADVVPYQELPKYNDKRRSRLTQTLITNLYRARSNPQLSLLFKSDPSNGRLSLNGESVYDMSTGRYSSTDDTVMYNRSLPRKREPFMYDRSKAVSIGRIGPSSDAFDSPRSMSISSSSSLHSKEAANSMTNSEVDRINSIEGEPRTVILRQGEFGFGFILRGAKVLSEDSVVMLDFNPTREMPSLQYFDHVDRASVADKAGIKSGDFLLEINGRNVRSASHDLAVQLIQESGDELELVIVTPVRPNLLDSIQPESEDTYSNIAPPPNEYDYMKFNNGRGSINGSDRISNCSSRYTVDSIAELDLLDEALLGYDVTSCRSDEVAPPDEFSIASIRSVHGKKLTGCTPGEAQTNTDTLSRRRAFCGDNLWRPTSTQHIPTGSLSRALGKQQTFDASQITKRQISEPDQDTSSMKKTAFKFGTVSACNDCNPVPYKYDIRNFPVNNLKLSDDKDDNYVNAGGSQVFTPNGTNNCVVYRNHNPGGKDSRNDPQFNNRRWSELPQQSDMFKFSCKDSVGRIKPPVPPRKPTSVLSGGSGPSGFTRTISMDSAVIPGETSVIRNQGDVNKENSSSSTGNYVRKNSETGGADFLQLAETARKAFVSKKISELGNSISNSVSGNKYHVNNGQGIQNSPTTNGKKNLNEDFSHKISNKATNDKLNVKSSIPEASQNPAQFQESLVQALSRRAAEMAASRERKSREEGTKPRSVVIRGITVDHSSTDSFCSPLPAKNTSVNTPHNSGKDAAKCSNSIPIMSYVAHSPAQSVSINLSSQFPGRIGTLEKTKVASKSFDTVDSTLNSYNLSSNPQSKQTNGTPSDVTLMNNGEMNPCDNSDLDIILPAPPGFSDEVVPPTARLVSPTRYRLNSLPNANGCTSLSNGCSSKLICDWSVEDVCDWLRAIDLGEYSSHFRIARITGQQLAELGRNELISLGVEQVGHRMNIERAIKKLIMIQHI